MFSRKSSCACGGGCPSCRGTSYANISQPSDPAEIEADATADRVMRMPGPDAKAKLPLSHKASEDRRTPESRNEQKEEAGERPVSRKEGFALGVPTPPPNTPPAINNVINSTGQPLDPQTRRFFEPRFGADLADVRVHHDPASARSAQQLNARAYTLGNNIVFGSGEFHPDTDSGKRLIAHELAHVRQGNSKIHRQPKPDAVVDPIEIRLEGLPKDGLKLMARSTRTDANIIDKEAVQNGDLVIPEFGVNDNQGKVWAWINVPDKRGADVPINKTYAKARGYSYPILHGFIELEYLGNLTIPITIYAKPPEKKEEPPLPVVPEKREKPEPPPSRSTSDIIDDATSYLDLKEDVLGRKLLEYADAGDFSTVESVLDELGGTDRDDVSFELTKAASEDQLVGMAQTSRGKQFLDRLYDEMTSGSADADEGNELAQAERILMAKARWIDPKQFMKADEKALIIPFSASGFTKLSTASLQVTRDSDGKLWVRSYMKTEHWENARFRTKDDFKIMYGGGIQLDPDEVVGVYLYDEGGKTVFMPALYLLQLSNAETTKVGSMAAEAFITGLTFGAGSGAVAVAEGANATRLAIWGSRLFSTLKWTDRAAAAFVAASTLINDHRGWIIQKWGDEGREFLKDWAKVDRVLMIYGLSRGAIALGQLGWGLRASFKNWREAANKADDLTDDQTKIVKELGTNTEKTIEEIEDAQKSAGMGPKAPEPLTAKDIEDAANATDELNVVMPNPPAAPAKPPTVSAGKAADLAEDAGAEVVDLNKYRQKKAAQQKVRQSQGQMKKTGTDDTVAMADDVDVAANDNDLVQSSTSPSSPSSSGKPATVTPITSAPTVDLSPFKNAADLQKNNVIGKKVRINVNSDLPEGYHWRDGKVSRNPGKRKEKYAPLEYDKQTKKLKLGTSEERISNPSEMHKNYKNQVRERIRDENASNPLSKGELETQVKKEVADTTPHHLIPDNVVQDHPFADAARQAGYDLDQGSNLQGLKKSEALTDVKAGDTGHWSSHPKYDKLVENELDAAQEAIKKEFGPLDDAFSPADLLKTDAGKKRLILEMKKIEDKFRKMFETRDKRLPIDKETGRITELVPEPEEDELEKAYA